MGKRDLPAPAPATTPFHSPFAALKERAGEVAAAGAPLPAAPPVPRPGPPPPARAVVRMERAGRGGKTVTVVEKLALPPRQLEAWLSDLKRALGCGGVVEGESLVLQGDVRQRAASWLAGRAVRKVTVA